MGVWVGGQDATNTSHESKDAQENSTSFDINFITGGGRGKGVSNEKPTKNWKLRGLKLRGLRRNQISTANLIYQNDQHDKTYTLGNF